MLMGQWAGVRNSQGLGEGLALNKKEKRRIPFSLLPDLWCLTAQPPCFSCHGELYPHTVSQNNPPLPILFFFSILKAGLPAAP